MHGEPCADLSRTFAFYAESNHAAHSNRHSQEISESEVSFSAPKTFLLTMADFDASYKHGLCMLNQAR